MEEKEHWAIIKTRGKAKTIDLGEYEQYEWSEFSTLKKDNEWEKPILFDNYNDAFNFIFESFKRDEISEELLNIKNSPEGFHW